MSRKRSRPPISLFSFQDIITSVTAIMIVIVMCLTLELIERSEQSSPAVEAVAVDALEAAIEDLRLQLEKLRLLTAMDPTQLAEAAAVTPSQIVDEIADLNRQLLDADAVIAREEERNAALQQESAKTDARRFDAQSDFEELQQLADRVKQAEVRLQGLLDLERPIYVMPRGSSRKGWLVVVDGSGINAARIGERAPPLVFRTSLQFLNWIGESGTHQRYFMVIVRPGGADLFHEIEEGLTKRRVSFGFDVTGTDQELLDPTLGAGAP